MFHRHIWRVEDVNLTGENDSEVSELGYSSQFLAFSYSVHSPGNAIILLAFVPSRHVVMNI